jgi:hypothetical protein
MEIKKYLKMTSCGSRIDAIRSEPNAPLRISAISMAFADVICHIADRKVIDILIGDF